MGKAANIKKRRALVERIGDQKRRRAFLLTDADWQKAKQIGEGDATLGVRVALRMFDLDAFVNQQRDGKRRG